MLVNVKRHAIAYPAGIVLDSQQTRTICGTAIWCDLSVGGRFMMPGRMDKVLMTESIGGVVLERCFLSLPTLTEKTLIPLYVKVYDVSTAPVLLIQKGIEHAYHLLTGKHVHTSFLKDFIFQCTMSEIECMDHTLYDILTEFFDTPALDSTIGNDSTSPLNKGGSVGGTGYPWDTTAFISNPVRVMLEEAQAETPKQVASSVHDLYLSVDLYDTKDGSWMLYNAVSDYFKPELGEIYSEVAYDTLTDLCIQNAELDGGTVLRQSGTFWPHTLQESRITKASKFEFITSFSSNLLQLCVWVHELPFREFGLRYILPSKTSLEKLEWKYARTYKHVRPDIQGIRMDLEHITRFWNNDQFQEIELYKTSADEMLIVLRGPTQERRLYVDLTISTLLSQSITASA